ncbi:CDP-alcohol phosphatidyltransferase family protein [Thermocatellispora tengchongensis]|uniref:CDP-alcohol phosphatidyltransferase family protein n=1 Tax=Thermocatellispora tengchongensis TaxID=1073253 RepID=UPI00363C38A1
MTALVVSAAFAPGVPRAPIVALGAAVLLLDWADGQVARRTGTETALGARFDMEVDAFLILVLSAYAAASAGPWALAIGLMRYAWVAAGRAAPWLRAPLPPSLARKAVAAVQGIVLVAAAAGVTPRPVTTAMVAAALALLAWSFGRDGVGLWRTRHRPSSG